MTLSFEQLQLLYYLLPTIFIGFFFGYLFARALSKEKYEPKLATLAKKISGKNIKIEQASKQQIELEGHIANQATQLLSSKKRTEDMDSLKEKFKQTSALLNREKETLKSTLMQRESELSKLKKEIDVFKNKLVNMQDIADKFKDETLTQKEKIFELESDMQMLTQGISKRDSLMSELEKINKDQRAEIISNSKE